MKRSPCCKHRFCVELTAVVATSLQFTALCAIISPLSQSLSSSVFTFDSNQPPIIMIMGLDPRPRSTFLLFYCCCSVLHWRSSEHFQKPSTSDLPEVSIEIPWCIEMIYHYSENISLDLPHHCSLLSVCEEKCFFSNVTGQLSSSKESFVAIWRRNRSAQNDSPWFSQQWFISPCLIPCSSFVLPFISLIKPRRNALQSYPLQLIESHLKVSPRVRRHMKRK